MARAATAVLAVIPARGGSRRVPGKNIRPMLGRPLMAYTIEAALESGVCDEVVVSTDSAEIAAIARAHGASVPFLRDATLADDHVPVSAATADALARLGGPRRFGAVAQLMPNCPLRTAADVCASHARFMTGPADAQLSVTRFGWCNPWWAMRLDAESRLEPIFEDRVQARSQDLPDLVCPTGAIWWARAEALERNGTFHLPGRTGWELPWWRAADIDTEADWQAAELLLRGTLAGEVAGVR